MKSNIVPFTYTFVLFRGNKVMPVQTQTVALPKKMRANLI